MNRSWLFIFLLVFVLPGASEAQTLTPEEQRARETLRRTILEREKAAADAAFAAPATPTETDFAVMERRYLDGKITARQFQRFIREHKNAPVAPVRTNTPAQTEALAVLRQAKPTATNPPPAQNPLGVRPQEQTQPGGLSAVEAKMNELLRKKNERALASDTNAVVIDPTDPAQAMTKRQRLDAILKFYIEGRITEADYQTRRGKIMAMPD